MFPAPPGDLGHFPVPSAEESEESRNSILVVEMRKKAIIEKQRVEELRAAVDAGLEPPTKVRWTNPDGLWIREEVPGTVYRESGPAS